MKRVTSITLSALSLISLAALSACGGNSGSGTDEDAAADKPKATASKEKQATPAERLKQLMITKADVSDKNVNEPDSEFAFAASQKEVTVEKPVCTPLAYAMNQLPLGEPQADLTRVVNGGLNQAFTYVTLTTYDSGRAESAMAGLSEAVDACGGGFTAKTNDDTSAYDSVTAEKPVAEAGDESLAFQSTLTFRGTPHTMHTQVVRSGDVLAVYFSVDGTAIANSRPSDAKLPAAVVKAQNAKLG
ncbi:hypothetical protein ACIF80_04385 [Streptomyces sp. NPDC085927]|uniref:hypothetical protein n=1 Tax=Streptomyces sp. NPDC085927 TaxID=3365738 RepID=UPI0037D17E1F